MRKEGFEPPNQLERIYSPPALTTCILSLNCDLTYKCRTACTSLFFMPKILNHHKCLQYNLRGYTVTASDMCVYFHRFFQDKKGIEPLDAIKHR